MNAFTRHLSNIARLGVKELWSLWRDPMMLVLILYLFTVAVYSSARAIPETLHLAAIAVVDEDRSPLSQRIVGAFYPPLFTQPAVITRSEMDAGMDTGDYTFVLNIPPNFQRDVLAGRAPAVQLNVDATRMSQAFSGSGYIQQMVLGEVQEFARRYRASSTLPVDMNARMRFNPTLTQAWFGGAMQYINYITLVSILLTGAALIREREHGTVEHLLVMPVTPTEIMLAKIWAMALVVLLASALSLNGVIRGLLQVPIEGSLGLFFCGVTLHLFATTSMGIFMATLARSMPQFGLLMVLVMMPLQMLSGGVTPRESMPAWVQWAMSLAPTTHFTELSQAILYRGAGIDVVWSSFVALALIGSVLFALSLRRFRATIAQLA